MFDARTAVRDLREVIAAELLLILETERAVIGRDDLQIVALQPAPQLVLIELLANRRRHHPLRAFEIGLLVNAVIEEEILRTRLRVRGDAFVARARHFLQRVVA